jgi:hypothetical protein
MEGIPAQHRLSKSVVEAIQKRKLGNSNLENVGAVAVDLSAGHLQQIEIAASKITGEGARYPEHIEKMTGL